ncbi:MAG: hypothetical protein QM736_02590 [Vicinamibacterales bacterium]
MPFTRTMPNDGLCTDGQWTVYRCAHGCVHLVRGTLTLTFTVQEFYAFGWLLQYAAERLSTAPTGDVPVTLPH